jgi:hypothetical protein
MNFNFNTIAFGAFGILLGLFVAIITRDPKTAGGSMIRRLGYVGQGANFQVVTLFLGVVTMVAGLGFCKTGQATSVVAVAPVASHATVPADQSGQVPTIHLSAGEYFDGWLITTEANPAGPGVSHAPLSGRRYFSTTTNYNQVRPGIHTLRDFGGNAVIIVKDPQ